MGTLVSPQWLIVLWFEVQFTHTLSLSPGNVLIPKRILNVAKCHSDNKKRKMSLTRTQCCMLPRSSLFFTIRSIISPRICFDTDFSGWLSRHPRESPWNRVQQACTSLVLMLLSMKVLTYKIQYVRVNVPRSGIQVQGKKRGGGGRKPHRCHWTYRSGIDLFPGEKYTCTYKVYVHNDNDTQVTRPQLADEEYINNCLNESSFGIVG